MEISDFARWIQFIRIRVLNMCIGTITWPIIRLKMRWPFTMDIWVSYNHKRRQLDLLTRPSNILLFKFMKKFKFPKMKFCSSKWARKNFQKAFKIEETKN